MELLVRSLILVCWAMYSAYCFFISAHCRLFTSGLTPANHLVARTAALSRRYMQKMMGGLEGLEFGVLSFHCHILVWLKYIAGHRLALHSCSWQLGLESESVSANVNKLWTDQSPRPPFVSLSNEHQIDSTCGDSSCCMMLSSSSPSDAPESMRTLFAGLTNLTRLCCPLLLYLPDIKSSPCGQTSLLLLKQYQIWVILPISIEMTYHYSRHLSC